MANNGHPHEADAFRLIESEVTEFIDTKIIPLREIAPFLEKAHKIVTDKAYEKIGTYRFTFLLGLVAKTKTFRDDPEKFASFAFFLFTLFGQDDSLDIDYAILGNEEDGADEVTTCLADEDSFKGNQDTINILLKASKEDLEFMQTQIDPKKQNRQKVTVNPTAKTKDKPKESQHTIELNHIHIALVTILTQLHEKKLNPEIYEDHKQALGYYFNSCSTEVQKRSVSIFLEFGKLTPSQKDMFKILKDRGLIEPVIATKLYKFSQEARQKLTLKGLKEILNKAAKGASIGEYSIFLPTNKDTPRVCEDIREDTGGWLAMEAHHKALLELVIPVEIKPLLKSLKNSIARDIGACNDAYSLPKELEDAAFAFESLKNEHFENLTLSQIAKLPSGNYVIDIWRTHPEKKLQEAVDTCIDDIRDKNLANIENSFENICLELKKLNLDPDTKNKLIEYFDSMLTWVNANRETWSRLISQRYYKDPDDSQSPNKWAHATLQKMAISPSGAFEIAYQGDAIQYLNDLPPAHDPSYYWNKLSGLMTVYMNTTLPPISPAAPGKKEARPNLVSPAASPATSTPVSPAISGPDPPPLPDNLTKLSASTCEV